jgi:neutral ceramidase
MIGGFLSVPTKEQIECQQPKPILLNTGNAKLPYLWDPASVPISVFQVGQLYILSVPGELTTMAGRRLRGAIRALLAEHEIKDPVITIAGLANSYTHYVTTFEEYAGQRYEAASTLYGPHTLSAYIQEFERITRDLLDGSPSASDKAPDDLSSKQWTLVPPVEFDTIGIGKTVSYSLFHMQVASWHRSRFPGISVWVRCRRCTGSI